MIVELYLQIDWLDTIQSVFASEGIVIGYSEKLVVQAYDYILQLVPLLQQTPSRTIGKRNFQNNKLLRNNIV